MTQSLKTIQNKPYNYFLIFCWILVALFAFGRDAAGKIEGYYAPVASPLYVSSIERTNFGLILEAEHTKLRSCDFLSIDWYMNSDTSTLNTKLFSLAREDNVTEKGQTYLRTIYVNTKPDNLKRTTAYTNHRCHLLYDTITKVYGE